MKNSIYFCLLKCLSLGLFLLIFSTNGSSQSTDIQLIELNIPNSISVNSLVTITGKYKNVGNTTYSGSLGLHLHVKDDENSGVGKYYSSETHSVGFFTLQPNEEAVFSAQIYVMESLFNAISKDIIIIFPKVGNETNPSSPPMIQEVNVEFGTP